MIRVTCAIIRNEDDQILVVQRGENSDHPFKWEFPGGKVEKGETDEDSIIREIREELSMDIVICRKLAGSSYDYGKKAITLIPFICDTLDDLPILSEHSDFRWIRAGELKNIEFSEADVAVAAAYLDQCDLSVQNAAEDLPEPNDPATDDSELINMINRMMSSKEAEWIASSAAENSVLLRKLLTYSFTDDKKLAFKASWALTKVHDKLPGLISSYLPLIIKKLDTLQNESARRSLLRILSLSDLSKLNSEEHGILADHCFRMLKDGNSAIAVKAYSMEALYKLALLYPGLVNELSVTINMIQGDGSAGIIARGRMILKKLAEVTGQK